MLKKLLIATALIGFIGAAPTAQADAPRAHTNLHAHSTHNTWGSDRDYTNRKARHHEVIERTFNQRIRNAGLPLLKRSGLKQDYRGYRIDAVVVTVRPGPSKGRIGLVINGKRVDAERLGDKRVIRLRPGDVDVLGRDLRSMRLDVRGRAFVKDVKIKMSKRAYSKNDRNGRKTNGFIYSNVNQQTARLLARAILAQIQNGQNDRHNH